MGEFPTQKQEDFARAIEDAIGVPLPTMKTKQAYSQYISENINAYKRERQKWHGIDDYNWETKWLRGRRMTREELRDYVDEQRSLNMIPYHVYSTLIDGIDTLEQEPRKGHWKHNKCDVCGASRPPLFDNFCPNCGAKMEEVEE